MNNRLVYILLAILVALNLFFVYNYYARNEDIVYVNAPKLISEYKGMKEVQKKIETKNKSMQSNLDTLTSELETEIRKLEKDRVKMPLKELKLAEEVLKNKHNQFLQYREAVQQKISKEDEKLQQEVLEEVNAFIKDYGKTKKYKYILGATQMANIIYAEDYLEITNIILEQLNKNYEVSNKK